MKVYIIYYTLSKAKVSIQNPTLLRAFGLRFFTDLLILIVLINSGHLRSNVLC